MVACKLPLAKEVNMVKEVNMAKFSMDKEVNLVGTGNNKR
jgi:hypothetical protein